MTDRKQTRRAKRRVRKRRGGEFAKGRTATIPKNVVERAGVSLKKTKSPGSSPTKISIDFSGITPQEHGEEKPLNRGEERFQGEKG